LERRPYGERPDGYEYRLTDKGQDLWPVLIELMQWGDKHAATPNGPPVILRHVNCGGAVGPHRACTRCGDLLERADVRAEVGPGAAGDSPLLIRPGAR
jgi:hypothetical protein